MSIFKLSVAQTYYQKLGEWQIDNTANNFQNLNLSYSTADKVVMLGSYSSNGTPGSMNISYQSTCGALQDFILLEFDSSLNFNHTFRLGGLGGESSLQSFYSSKHSHDTLIFVGSSWSPDTGCNIHSVPRGGTSDIWVVISDTLGAVKNERLIGTSVGNDAVLSSVFLDSSFVLNMYFNLLQSPNGDLWNLPPNCVSCPQGSSMVNLSTFDYSLQKTNEKYIGPFSDNLQGTLLYDSVHHAIYLVGMVNTTQANVMNVTEAGTGNDVWVVKMDEQLNIIWNKRVLTPFDEFGIISVKFLLNGHLLVSGQSNAYYGPGLQGVYRGGQDIFIYELDTTAQIINDRCYGTTGYDAVGLCSVLKNGQIMVSIRTTEGISADKAEVSRGGNDIWYLFLDANLDIVFQKTLGGSGQENLSLPGLGNKDEPIYEWPDGSILVGIESTSGFSGDKTIPASLSNPSNSDIWLVRFRPGLLTGLEDVPTVITTPFVFPNPANDAITLQVEQAKSYRVVQLDGRELISGTNSPPNAFTIDCSTWSSGVYFVEVIQQNGARWLNKVVKE